jgi:RNA polymerase sigma-70 factor, ECF subfamily
MRPLLASGPRVDRSFERLYRRHVTDVYHYALAVLRNPADAEDVTQTTFLNAYRAYRRGEHPAAPRNWLIAIAHNVCRQRFRQSARRPQEVAFDEDVGEAIVQDDGPSAQDIRTALGHLAFNQRAALVMRELEGRSYTEIAEILELTVSAVETLIFRARRALREQLEGSLTCQQAELALSRQLDGRLPRGERGALRAHLRACGDCASFARSQRAQRAALRSIAAIPLPGSLASFFGGGGAAAGVGLAAKAATVVVVGAVVGGVGYEGVKHISAGREQALRPRAATPVGSAALAATAEARADEARALASPTWAVPHRRSGRAAAAARKADREGGRAEAKRPGKLTSSRARGRPEAPPGRAKTRARTDRGSSAKALRARGAPRGNARGHDKPKGKPATRPGSADQSGKSDSAGKEKEVPPPVSTPALPPPPLSPPALPDLSGPGKVKK